MVMFKCHLVATPEEFIALQFYRESEGDAVRWVNVPHEKRQKIIQAVKTLVEKGVIQIPPATANFRSRVSYLDTCTSDFVPRDGTVHPGSEPHHPAP